MNANIKYDGNEELGQILRILLAMGYKFHGEDRHTPDGVIEKYKDRKFDNVLIQGDGHLSLTNGFTYGGNVWTWSNDFNEIMNTLPNLTIKKRIIIENVGEYKATVTKGNARIFGHNVTLEQVNEIYKATRSKLERPFKFSVHTKTLEEHRTLMAIIYSFGYRHNGYEDYQEAHLKKNCYTSTNIYGDKSIGGNYFEGENDLDFSSDFAEIYKILSETTEPITIPLGKYDAVVYSDRVVVGCQEIEFSKVEEILNALIKLQ